MKKVLFGMVLGLGFSGTASQAETEGEVIGLYTVNHQIDSPACIVGKKCTYEHRNDAGFTDAFRIEVEANSHAVKVEEKLRYWCTDGSKVVTRFEDDRFVVEKGETWQSPWYRCPEGQQVSRVKVKAGTTEYDNDNSDSRVYIIIQD